MSKSCINAFKKQNSDHTKGGNNKETFLIDEFKERGTLRSIYYFLRHQ